MAATPHLRATLTIVMLWGWLNIAQAQPNQLGLSQSKQKQTKLTDRKEKSDIFVDKNTSGMPPQAEHQKLQAHVEPGTLRIGGYFQPHQQKAARDYYGRPENQGFCPPGLAKKGNHCLPPGQAKKWQKGQQLPADVVYFELPRSVVLSLGPPPNGYRYVRVASDILLIGIGTNMVIDAIEDLVR